MSGFAASVATLFPEMFPGPLGHSLPGRSLERGEWTLSVTDIRDFAGGRHRQVDDAPFGGGAGMVMRPDVVDAGLAAAAVEGAPLIHPSPRGRLFDQAMARDLAAGPGMTLLCGRYEGVDQRVLEARGVLEVSIGDYVLMGGEIAAMVLIETCVRLRAGVVGKAESIAHDSHADGLLEHPHYTRPAEWRGRAVPDILLSGHHAKVMAWRRRQAEDITRRRRPDLWERYNAVRGKRED